VLALPVESALRRRPLNILLARGLAWLFLFYRLARGSDFSDFACSSCFAGFDLAARAFRTWRALLAFAGLGLFFLFCWLGPFSVLRGFCLFLMFALAWLLVRGAPPAQTQER